VSCSNLHLSGMECAPCDAKIGVVLTDHSTYIQAKWKCVQKPLDGRAFESTLDANAVCSRRRGKNS
jgi:hypothetical protein